MPDVHREMKLHGMAKAMRQWLEQPKDKDPAPTDLLGLRVDTEQMHRDNRKLQLRLKNAKLRQPACVEDIDYIRKAESWTGGKKTAKWPPPASSSR